MQEQTTDTRQVYLGANAELAARYRRKGWTVEEALQSNGGQVYVATVPK